MKTTNKNTSTKEGKVKFWRLMQIDDAIREKMYPTVESLAKEFEVTTRTIERDIAFMRDMYNAPIQYDHSHKGYIYTSDTFFLKSIFLTEDEFFSVAIFEKLLRQYRNTPIEELLKNVFKKLNACTPNKSISIDTLWVDNSVTFISEPAPDIESSTFKFVFEAIKLKCPITFSYRSLKTDKHERRKINPYHIICQRSVWYVIGLCKDKNDLRIFSFSRMKDFQLVKDEHFEVPNDFNLAECIDSNIGIWLTKRKPFTVRLLFSPEVGVFAEERIWNKKQKVTVHSDKSVEVSFKTTQLEEIKRFVLGQGSTVKVLEPSELITEVKTELSKMNKLYS